MLACLVSVVVALAPGASLVAAPAGAIAVRLPDLPQLVQAARSGDDVEIERVAARLGAVRLERIAERGKRDERLAALRALGLVDDSWWVLPDVAKLLADAQPEVAEQSALTARRIAEGMTPQMLDGAEVPVDVPERAATELMKQASRGELRPSVRVAAVAAFAALRAVARVDDTQLVKLLSDGEPQVRRAAAEALSGAPAPRSSTAPATIDKALEQTLASDADAQVAAAAAATLCRDVPPTPVPKSAAEQRAARLGAQARDRLRALAVDEKVSLADRLDLLGCVRVNAKPDDQKLLDALSKKPPESLRRRARSLGGR